MGWFVGSTGRTFDPLPANLANKRFDGGVVLGPNRFRLVRSAISPANYMIYDVAHVEGWFFDDWEQEATWLPCDARLIASPIMMAEKKQAWLHTNRLFKAAIGLTVDRPGYEIEVFEASAKGFAKHAELVLIATTEHDLIEMKAGVMGGLVQPMVTESGYAVVFEGLGKNKNRVWFLDTFDDKGAHLDRRLFEDAPVVCNNCPLVIPLLDEGE